MKLATILPALCLTATLSASGLAQTPQFTDPANLRGERVKPRDGRELPIDGGQGNTSLGLQQLLRRLNTRASILNIVAHPDDEDGGMLTFYSRGLGARVADLSLTRGEGGQNAMTGDFEDALGLLRTQELLANDRYTGVDQMFGTEVDFGFSKTKSEAFAKWTHDRVLYDAVRAIRLYRPLVITSTWTGNVTDGHGQHQVSGQIAQEAFVAAADPKVFPDMIAEGILPWQALRVYARVPQGAITGKGLYDYATNQYVPATFTNYVTGEVTTTVPSTDVTVHEGTTDPLLTPASANPADLQTLSTGDWQPGAVIKTPPAANPTGLPSPTAPLSYLQFARIGLSLQKSQIGPTFRIPPTGTFDVPYHIYGSALCSSSTSPKDCHPERSAERAAEGPATLPALGTSPEPSKPEFASAVPATNQVPRGFSLGSHGPSTDPGFSPEGTPSAPSPDPNFFTGIDTSILSLQQYHTFPTDLVPKLAGDIESAIQHFDPAHPEAIAPTLADALKIDDELIRLTEKSDADPLQKANALHELRIKRVQLNDALSLSLGITFRLIANTKSAQTNDLAPVVMPQSLKTTWHVLKRSNEPVTLLGIAALGGNFIPVDLSHTFDVNVALNLQVDPSQGNRQLGDEQYFSRPSIEQPYYNLQAPELRNAPAKPALFQSSAFFRYRGAQFDVTALSSPRLGAVPALSVNLPNHAIVLPAGESAIPITMHIQNSETNKAGGEARLVLPDGWSSEPLNAPFTLNKTNPSAQVSFQVKPKTLAGTGSYILQAEAKVDSQTYTEGYRPIGYGDLPRTNDYTPATTRIVPVDLTLPTRHNIAYLPGTGDAVPEALASINLTPTILTVADLTPATLAKYDTVILGVRTYSAHPDLHGAPTQALLDYARNGGNVVVQYQTPEFTAADAPYPLSLGSNEKVVDETAPVALLDATSPLLTAPNRITPADFDNWIEERGHGFLSTWDPHYTALTETHDPGAPSEHVAPQLPQRGGLITTPLGKGRWTYVAFALYRQLPEAVPGAYRLFLNLLNP
jgi:LmbE family N-acetylglucosaminyl deacetylase